MQDSKNPNSSFPTPEPPPHPHKEENASSGQVDTNLSNVMAPQTQESVSAPQTPQQVQPSQQVSQQFTPPKKFPNKALIIGGVVFLILTVSLLVVLRLRGSTNNLLGKKGEVIWWGYQHEGSVYAPLIEEFQRQNPNIKITYIKQSQKDYRERLTNALAQGTGPDIFEIHNSWIPIYQESLSQLTPSVMGEEEYKKSYYPIFDTTLRTTKGIVGMPLEYDALTLFINEDIFALAAKSPPQTWDELRELVDPGSQGSLTLIDNKKVIIQSGVALGETVNVDHWPEILALMFFQNSVNPANPAGEPSTAVISFYTLFKTMKVWDNTLPDSTVAFARGKLAMYFGPTSRATELIEANPDLRFRTVRLPQLPKNVPTDPDFSYATFWFQGVWNKSTNQEAAWQFLKYLATPESLQKINMNIKVNESTQRAYPRPEMNIALREDKIVGSIIANALDAKAWYMADNTNDGPTGINSQIKVLFEDAIINWLRGSQERRLEQLTGNLKQILSQYAVPVN